MKIGIIGAMEEEIQCIKENMAVESHENYAGLVFYKGLVNNTSTILVMSGIGKVNAALCSQILITKFEVDCIVNTGLAGALDDSLELGDIVVSTDLLEHDMDATNFGYPLGVIPRMEKSIFEADSRLVDLSVGVLKGDKKVHRGRIVSGDIFIADTEKRVHLRETFGGACAEMEGAAIAHVCHVNDKPFVIIRTVSDKADHSAASNFNEFVQEHAHESSRVVVKLINELENE